jgi:hypothetical protein
MKNEKQLELASTDFMPPSIKVPPGGLAAAYADARAKGGWPYDFDMDGKSGWILSVVWNCGKLLTFQEALAAARAVVINPNESAVLSMKLQGR